MREYRIKRGYDPDIKALLKEYFGVEGDVEKGVSFFAEGIGKMFIKREGQKLLVETEPSSKKGDYSVIKKWNEFIFRATGKTAKERRKEMLKI